ncbi:MAG: glycosyltransferase family 4 protein [Pirellulales bacterium]|nr:glycosyltransferase family 4 protein [Pirellulales bacterium]
MARLLILCEYPTLSGGERSMFATLDGVARAGFDVSVMAPPEGPLAEACSERHIPIVAFSPVVAQGARPSLAQRRELLAGHLAQLQPDLLHANSLAMGRLAGPVAAELRTPSVAHLRDIIRLRAQAIGDLNRNSRLLAVSEAVRRFHVAAGLSGDKTFVLHNGVDLGQFCPRPPTGYLHRELGIPAGAPLIGSIGQIGLRKAQEVLFDAAIRLDASTEPGGTADLPSSVASSEPHWLVVGERWSDKPESRRFEQRLHEMARQIPGRVHFLGARGDVPRLLNELTLLVHAARQEPLGRVLLEAAASGTPVVATDVGGTVEIFAPGSARLVPPDDPAALAGAIAEALAGRESRLAMAAAARRRAEERFDAAQATAGLVEHYRALTE